MRAIKERYRRIKGLSTKRGQLLLVTFIEGKTARYGQPYGTSKEVVLKGPRRIKPNMTETNSEKTLMPHSSLPQAI